jgi:nucleoside-diphosphate kinase
MVASRCQSDEGNACSKGRSCRSSSACKEKSISGEECLYLERTLIVIKPDGVSRQLSGEILARFERKGFKVVALQLVRFDKDLAKDFYSPHVGKPFFPELQDFITSGPAIAAILEGPHAVDVVRGMIGVTKSFEAASGTIRGDFALGYTDNVIHASDSDESFQRESKILFPSFIALSNF